MLPMIVTVNLSKGALAMARKKVIVKRLNAIQNFGAMDVLLHRQDRHPHPRQDCARKTSGRGGRSQREGAAVWLPEQLPPYRVEELLDEAILEHKELREHLKADEKYHKIDEIPFDFVRRRMSVVVEDDTGLNTLICKGAVEEVLGLCTRVEVKGEVIEVLPTMTPNAAVGERSERQGFRVIALAYKQMPGGSDEPVYSVKDDQT